eukprot:gene12196-18874_t
MALHLGCSPLTPLPHRGDYTPSPHRDTPPPHRGDHTPSHHRDTPPHPHGDHTPSPNRDTPPLHHVDHTPSPRRDTPPTVVGDDVLFLDGDGLFPVERATEATVFELGEELPLHDVCGSCHAGPLAHAAGAPGALPASLRGTGAQAHSRSSPRSIGADPNELFPVLSQTTPTIKELDVECSLHD